MKPRNSRFSLSLIAADGLCSIDPVVGPGKLSAIGTYQDVAVGVAGVIQDCVVLNPEHIGGSGRNVSE